MHDEAPVDVPADLRPDIIAAHVPLEGGDGERTRWFIQRFAGAIASCYRTMDPIVGQVVSAPGVTPIVVDGD